MINSFQIEGIFKQKHLQLNYFGSSCHIFSLEIDY